MLSSIKELLRCRLGKSLRQAFVVVSDHLQLRDQVVIVPSLPKTRSGKIMRRILRKVACGEEGWNW